MNTKLHVRSAGLNPDFAHHQDRRVAHRLVLAIGQRLRWRDGYGISGMHAHGVHIFNRADDDDVIRKIAHHFQFVFFPSKHRLFDQALMHRRKIETARKNFNQLLAVVSETTARAAERK